MNKLIWLVITFMVWGFSYVTLAEFHQDELINLHKLIYWFAGFGTIQSLLALICIDNVKTIISSVEEAEKIAIKNEDLTETYLQIYETSVPVINNYMNFIRTIISSNSFISNVCWKIGILAMFVQMYTHNFNIRTDSLAPYLYSVALGLCANLIIGFQNSFLEEKANE